MGENASNYFLCKHLFPDLYCPFPPIQLYPVSLNSYGLFVVVIFFKKKKYLPNCFLWEVVVSCSLVNEGFQSCKDGLGELVANAHISRWWVKEEAMVEHLRWGSSDSWRTDLKEEQRVFWVNLCNEVVQSGAKLLTLWPTKTHP